MRTLWILFAALQLSLSGCGPRLPKIPKSKFTDWKSAAFEADQVTFDFVLWLTWAGLACVVVGVVWLLWASRKDVGIRIIFTGLAFNLVAKAITFYETYNWLVWTAIGVSLFIYCLLNPRRVEKVLARMHIFVDIDGDGMIGTGRTSKKAGKKWLWFFRRKYVEPETSPDIENDHSLSHDDIETDIIPNQD